MIEFQHVCKSYKDKAVLHDITCTVKTGEFIVLIGSSGCGKTTLLKAVNKLHGINSGDILIDGKSIKDLNEITLRRRIGYVVQDGGLFPHLTIEENINLVLDITGYPKDKCSERVTYLLDMVDLVPDEYRFLYPCQLSGGQRQRVGVARAFAADPNIILMDEPFSALDPVTRAELQSEIIGLHQQTNKTILFVTHDMDEAIKLADRICIIEDGKLIQFDIPEIILKQPADVYVEHFVGKNRLWGNPDLIKAKDIMKTNPCTITENRTVLQALQIMKHYNVDSVLVTAGKKLTGIIWLSDLQDFKDYRMQLTDYISHDYKSVYNDTSLQEILNSIDYTVSGIIPVINHRDELVGFLTKSSLLATLSKQYVSDDTERGTL